jgi:hypothetical protein
LSGPGIELLLQVRGVRKQKPIDHVPTGDQHFLSPTWFSWLDLIVIVSMGAPGPLELIRTEEMTALMSVIRRPVAAARRVNRLRLSASRLLVHG